MTGAGSANARRHELRGSGRHRRQGQRPIATGATNKQSATQPSSGAGSTQSGGASTGLEPGTGVEDSAQGEGATAKQGMPDVKEGKLPAGQLHRTNPRQERS